MTQTNHEVWQAVLAELELELSKANFITWFKNTGILKNEEGEILVCVPNTFSKAWIEKKYNKSIVKSLERITGSPIKKIEYKIENIKNIAEEKETQPEEDYKTPQTNFVPSTSSTPTSRTVREGSFTLNAKYTFDSYVVGKGSDLAYAASHAVADRPGEAYNPLFIYGGVGLGKTHLIQAIGNEALKNNPDTSILYVSAEKFSNDFIDSIKNGTAKEFQNYYRHIDILLIDDIQFIAGKDRTQESFFHTFNELHQQNKQVVLTSDRPPKAIPALEDRLKSRFEWGMIADVAPPDYETRVAILEKKCTEKKFDLESEIIQEIATSIHSNIRELEGTLNKIIAYHQLKNMKPSVESVKSLISSDQSKTNTSSSTPQSLMDNVTSFYGVQIKDILGKSREKKLSVPRQIIMFLMREELKMSYPAIGDELGGRDHTTAMHAHTKINSEIENDPKLRQDIELIKQKMYINNV